MQNELVSFAIGYLIGVVLAIVVYLILERRF